MATLNVQLLYEQLAIEDLQLAADMLSPLYKAGRGRDCFVSCAILVKSMLSIDQKLIDERRNTYS